LPNFDTKSVVVADQSDDGQFQLQLHITVHRLWEATVIYDYVLGLHADSFTHSNQKHTSTSTSTAMVQDHLTWPSDSLQQRDLKSCQSIDCHSHWNTAVL